MGSLSPNTCFPLPLSFHLCFLHILSWNLFFNRETNGRSLGIFHQKWACFGNRWAPRKISAFPFLFSSFKGFIFDKISEKGVKGGIEASPRQSCSYFLRLSCVREVVFSNLSWASGHSNWGSSCFIPGLPKKCCVTLQQDVVSQSIFRIYNIQFDAFMLIHLGRYDILKLNRSWWWRPLIATICTWNWKYIHRVEHNNTNNV